MSANELERSLVAVLRFGPYRLDTRRAELTRDGAVLELRPKSFSLLAYLAARPGRLVDRQELLTALWPGVVVTDDSVSQCVSELRAALGDDGPRWIRTVQRRGYRFDAPVSDDFPAAPASAAMVHDGAGPTRRRRLALRLAAACAVLLGAATWALWAWTRPTAGLDEEVWARRSIVVLPFVDAGGDQSPHFADGVTEEVIAALARVDQTRVIAHASAAAVARREVDLRRIGQELGVRYALTGRVRRDGDGVQIQARFTSTRDGTVLWTEQYDYAGLHAWQWPRDIALRIARSLDLRLAQAAAPQAERRDGDLSAVDAVMQASYLLRHAGSPADMRKARLAFESAAAKEPASVAALSGLALAHFAEVNGRYSDNPKAQVEAAAAAIDRALAIHADDSLAAYARGHLLFYRGDVEGALAAYQRVVAANPSHAWAHARVGLALLALGRLEEVLPSIAAAQRLSPLEQLQMAFSHYIAGVAEFHLGRTPAARARFAQSVAANPNFLPGWAWLAAVDALEGRQDQAAQSVAELRRRRPDISIRSMQAHSADRPLPARMQPGQQRYLEGLKKAGLPPH